MENLGGHFFGLLFGIWFSRLVDWWFFVSRIELSKSESLRIKQMALARKCF